MVARDKTVILIPAYNEAESLGKVLGEIRTHTPEYPVVVVSDGSTDTTAAVAERGGATVLNLPCNLGVGGAVQAGFRYAYESGFDYAVRIDADGQHPPAEIPKLVEAMRREKPDLVIGSRFLGVKSDSSTYFRYCAVRGLGLFLSLICRRRVTDPTSGFQMLNRVLLAFFSETYPADYPEPEALALMRRQGYDFREVPVRFRERTAGRSTISGWGTAYYAVKVFLALLVDRARPVNPRLERERLVNTL